MAFAPAAWAQSLAGLWNAAINVNETEVPFEIQFSGDGSTSEAGSSTGKSMKTPREVNSKTAR
jgi:hypothetical protein